MAATDTARDLVPVGEECLGRIFTSLATRSTQGPGETTKKLPIHRAARPFDEQEVEKQIFETGIKVVDLLAPYQRGGKVGCSRRRRRQDGAHPGADPQHRDPARRLLGVRRVGERTREGNDLYREMTESASSQRP